MKALGLLPKFVAIFAAVSTTTLAADANATSLCAQQSQESRLKLDKMHPALADAFECMSSEGAKCQAEYEAVLAVGYSPDMLYIMADLVASIRLCRTYEQMTEFAPRKRFF